MGAHHGGTLKPINILRLHAFSWKQPAVYDLVFCLMHMERMIWSSFWPNGGVQARLVASWGSLDYQWLARGLIQRLWRSWRCPNANLRLVISTWDSQLNLPGLLDEQKIHWKCSSNIRSSDCKQSGSSTSLLDPVPDTKPGLRVPSK